jgi:hypothetical protein
MFFARHSPAIDFVNIDQRFVGAEGEKGVGLGAFPWDNSAPRLRASEGNARAYAGALVVEDIEGSMGSLPRDVGASGSGSGVGG